MNRHKETFFSLLSTPSPTGFEMAGQRLWAQTIQLYCDEVSCDTYGTAYAWMRCGKKNAPVLMIEAHADEIGFMINYISPEGFLRVTRVGGVDSAVARGRRLRILGSQGEIIGVTGNTAIHLRRGNEQEEKAPAIHDIFVDIGVSSAEEVAKLGIRVGHVAVYADEPCELSGDKIMGRALDNRAGGYILTQIAYEFHKKKKSFAWDVVFVNAVQEEIGGYGASMISQTLRPQLALCIDVTHATDTPDINCQKFGAVCLGKGPSITHGSANHPLVVERLITVAQKKKIPVQHEATGSSTGTDTDSIFCSRKGIPAALVSLPLRYMHSPVETADWSDIEATSSLIEEFIYSLKASDTFNHTL